MKKHRRHKVSKKKTPKFKQKLRVSWLLFIIIAIILTIAARSGTSSTAQTATIKSPGPGEVNITSVGFKPSKLKILINTPVTWINVDARSHQVTIDPKSESSPVLGFDNHLTLRPGDSYSFTFIHPGTYFYRDRLTHGFRGVVEVR
jgi:plastocyanin